MSTIAKTFRQMDAVMKYLKYLLLQTLKKKFLNLFAGPVTLLIGFMLKIILRISLHSCCSGVINLKRK